jgi:hypothetical protein
MGAIGKVLTSEAFTGAVKAIGTLAQAKGQVVAGKAEAQTQKYNAAISRQEAKIVEDKKILETKRLMKRKKEILSTQRALFSKGGVLLEGSPLEVIRDTEAEIELDNLTNKYNRDVEKSRFLSEAKFREFEAGVAEREGRRRGRRTILTGLTRFAATAFEKIPKPQKDIGVGVGLKPF